MRIIRAQSKSWACFWPWPSLYVTRGGYDIFDAGIKQHALLFAWLWWILVLAEWDSVKGG